VSFVNSDPGRPVVIGGDAPDSPGWVPDELSLRVADMRVDVLESLIKLGTESGSGLDFVALAAKVDAQLTSIQTWADTHTHATAGTGTPSPAVPPLGALTSTAAENVKAS
jgi:hypothetical protein